MTSHRRTLPLAVAVMVAVLLAGCTPTVSDDRGVLKPVPSRTGAPYSVTLDGVHLSLLRPATLAPPASGQTTGFVSLSSTANPTDQVRLLVPATVCAAGISATALPSDYVAYLHTLTAVGLTIKGETSISIDGVSGTQLNLGATTDLPGVLGQSRGSGCTDKDSIGVTADESLRVAVFPVQNKTVLVWAATNAQSPTPGFFSTYQKMLQTVTFG